MEEGKVELILYLDAILEFTKAFDKELPDESFSVLTSKISELKEGIKNNRQFTSEEMQGYLIPVIDKIIKWNPVIKDQLWKFWKVQKQIIHELATKQSRTPYVPMAPLNSRIRQANLIYGSTFEKIRTDLNNPVLLYALFFSHISRFEVIEIEIWNHLSTNIKNCGLSCKYSREDFFFVNEKVTRNKSMVSDVKAIRDALAHLKFEIKKKNGLLTINFDNREGGYDFKKSYTVEQFWKLTNDLEILQKSQYILAIILFVIRRSGKFEKQS